MTTPWRNGFGPAATAGPAAASDRGGLKGFRDATMPDDAATAGWAGAGGALEARERGDRVPDTAHDGQLDGDLLETLQIRCRQDPLAPDLHARVAQQLLDQLLELGGGEGRRGASEEAPRFGLEPRVDRAQFLGQARLLPDLVPATLEDFLTQGHGGLAGPGTSLN